MFPTVIYYTFPNFLVLPLIILVVILAIAAVVRKRAATLHMICLIGLIVASGAPVLWLAGQALHLRQLNLTFPLVAQDDLSFRLDTTVAMQPVVDSEDLHPVESQPTNKMVVPTTRALQPPTTPTAITIKRLFGFLLDGAILLWLVGAIYFVLKIGIGLRQLKRMLAAATPISAVAPPQLVALASRLADSRIAFATHSGLATPIAAQEINSGVNSGARPWEFFETKREAR